MYIYMYVYIYTCLYVIYIYIYVGGHIYMSSSSLQWLCGDMSAMDSQWCSSRTLSVRTNRVLNKHKAKNQIT